MLLEPCAYTFHNDLFFPHEEYKKVMHAETWLTMICIILVVTWLLVRSRHTLVRPIPDAHISRFIEDFSFRTGDIILYHSNPFINWFTNSKWSHIAMVIEGKATLRLFEITGSSHYATAKPLLPELKKHLQDHRVVVGIRRLHPPPDANKLRKFTRMALQNKTHYEHVYWREFYQRLFGVLFPIKISDLDTAPNTTICSSFIAEALRHAGVLSTDVHPLQILPGDFGETTQQPIPLQDPYSIDPIVFLRARGI